MSRDDGTTTTEAPQLVPMTGAPQVAALDPHAANQAAALLCTVSAEASVLGNALAAAGYPRRRWAMPDVVLRELARDLPQPTLDTLLTRLHQLSNVSGPGWLSADGSNTSDFARETAMLGNAIRPLRALSLRQRLTPPAHQSHRRLERALADSTVGAHLDALARALRGLATLAPIPVLPTIPTAGPRLEPAASAPESVGDASEPVARAAAASAPAAAPGSITPAPVVAPVATEPVMPEPDAGEPVAAESYVPVPGAGADAPDHQRQVADDPRSAISGSSFATRSPDRSAAPPLTPPESAPEVCVAGLADLLLPEAAPLELATLEAVPLATFPPSPVAPVAVFPASMTSQAGNASRVPSNPTHPPLPPIAFLAPNVLARPARPASAAHTGSPPRDTRPWPPAPPPWREPSQPALLSPGALDAPTLADSDLSAPPLPPGPRQQIRVELAGPNSVTYELWAHSSGRKPAPPTPAPPARFMPAPPSWPLPRAWQRTSRRWPHALLVIAAILVVAGAVIATFAALNQAGLIGSLAPLRTAIVGHAVPTTPARPAPTHVPPTATPLPLPAVLAASPSFVHIPCPAAGMPASITLRDTGGRALSWRISSPPLLLLFSAYSGTLAPGASSTIQVRALLSQKSTRSLVFTSDGGSVTLSYKVGCH